MTDRSLKWSRNLFQSLGRKSARISISFLYLTMSKKNNIWTRRGKKPIVKNGHFNLFNALIINMSLNQYGIFIKT